jgi:hypothetical protein
MPAALPLQDLEAAELAYSRVQPELDALPLTELASINVEHRDRIAKLPEFEIRYVDSLVDYAKAA